MDRFLIDNLHRVLARRNMAPEAIRNDLWDYLDLADGDDEDANDLRFVLEKVDMPAALDEFEQALGQIRAREPWRGVGQRR
jgi:hypothetical protein